MESLATAPSTPISPRLQQCADAFFLLIFGVGVLTPIMIALARFAVTLDPEFLSPLFFLLLLKSTLFAFTQATASVLVIALFALGVAHLHFFLPASELSRKVFKLVGILSFSLSPTLVALTLIASFGHAFEKIPAGFWAIVFCHFLLNGAFFSALFLQRLDKFLSHQGRDLSLLLRTWGTGSWRQMALLIWPVFKVDFKSWAPQVFLWCFMSFSPIVLLASGPQQNTPEVLLYYSLLNDPSGSRMLIIFLLTAALSFGLNRLLVGRPGRTRGLHEESYALSVPPLASKRSSSSLFFVSLLLLLPFLYSLISPLFLSAPAPTAELWAALIPTSVIFAASFVLTFIFCVLTLFCSRELKIVSYANFISAPMILVGFLSLLTDLSGVRAWILIALGALLAVLPWIHRRLRSSVERLPADLRLLSVTLGLTDFTYFRFYLWPQLKDAIFSYSLLVALWSLGEYAFSKAILNRDGTLALYIEESLRRYRFTDAAFGLGLSLLFSVVVVTPILWKGKRRAAV